MNGMSNYDITKESLQGILQDISKGNIQLPEFQRDWLWDDAHVSSLIASVTLSYPIGAVMTLQIGGEEINFKHRCVEGANQLEDQKPEWLILDGQQRLTALFQALFSPTPVSTRDIRGKPIKRHYYVNIAAALSGDDREDVIISLPEDRIKRNFRGEIAEDYSTTEKECASGMLPLDIVLDAAALMDWQMKYFQNEPDKTTERIKNWKCLNEIILKPIQFYQVPIIQLKKETPKEAVCQVFEKVNTGGVTLTVFELLTATFAAEDYNLREDWTKRIKQMRKCQILKGLQSEDFLQAISLFVTKTRRDVAIENGPESSRAPGISCKRREILKLKCSDYKQWAASVQDGFECAARFLHQQKIFSSRDLPYRTQLVPLAAILAELGEDSEKDGLCKRIAQWYWCGVFGELYGAAVETRFAKDFPEVVSWVRGGSEPTTIADANFTSSRLQTLRTRNSAAYKGIYALLMRDRELDFQTGKAIEAQTYFDDRIDIHHIFPKNWCEKQGIPREKYDSIINKTALSARTNRKIGGRAPSQYLRTLERDAEITTDRMDEILNSHIINPALVRGDDFDAFSTERQEALLQRIEHAMGKPARREPLDTPESDSSDAETEERDDQDSYNVSEQ